MKLYHLLLLCPLMCACISPPPLPPRTPLQTRQMQTRTYSVSDDKLVMKAVLNVLQDEGFVTKNAVPELGLITASKEMDKESTGERVFHSILAGENASWVKTESLDCTSNVSRYGDETRVRISFQRRILDQQGRVVSVEEIADPRFYQDFLARVDKGIFIQKEDL